MTRVFKAQQLSISADDKPGTLARVTGPIAEARVNLNAICAWREGEGKATFFVLTSDNAAAKSSLEKAGYTVDEKEVLVIETSNEAGTLFRASQQLATAGVDLDYCYATAGKNGETWIVLGTPTIEKAMNVIP